MTEKADEYSLVTCQRLQFLVHLAPDCQQAILFSTHSALGTSVCSFDITQPSTLYAAKQRPVLPLTGSCSKTS
jgi:hypothetical protein